MIKGLSDSRFQFRLPPEELVKLHKVAEAAGKTTSEFVRIAVQRATEAAGEKDSEMVSRLVAMEERLFRIDAGLAKLGGAAEQIQRLAGSAVVSAALVLDDQGLSAEEYRTRINDHLSLAITSSSSLRSLVEEKLGSTLPKT